MSLNLNGIVDNDPKELKMVYSNKLVACVKCNGNIIREDKDIVKLPFQSEYSILLKNLSMQDAVVGIKINGEDALTCNKILVRANSSHELFGFMDSSGTITNKFKFIQKTDKIVEHRGDNKDDGFIVVDFQFERPTLSYTVTSGSSYSYNYPINYYSSAPYRSVSGASCSSENECCYASNSSNIAKDEGLTVKGSVTNQQYGSAYVNTLESEHHTIILKLVGKLDNTIIYTNTKLECSTCGTKSKSSYSFCPECGTSLK